MAGATERPSPEFIVRHEKLDLRIYLSSMNNLLLHEETIPERVGELKREFLRDEVVKDPVVIDSGSCVVLDGMHRVAALRELERTCVPVCAVNYLSPTIKVGAWYRSIHGTSSPDQVKLALSASGIRFEGFPFDILNITQNPALSILFANHDCFKLLSNDLQVFETLKIAEQCLRQLALTVKFETESDALQDLMNEKVEAIVTLPKIDKATVRRAGLTGRLLPHKVTRHVVPARPLGVNVPMKTLADRNTPLAELNQRFVSMLQTRGMTRRPSGTVIGGRRYEEETYVFN